jgi:hypothetical protein
MDEGFFFYGIHGRGELETNFPSRRGPKNIVLYMSGDQNFLEPIMSNSESIIGNNTHMENLQD